MPDPTSAGAVARGGKALYGASLGILMLETRFPRIPGDMGNAVSWPFPVHYRIVRGATPDIVVRKSATGMLDAFLDAAAELMRDGVDGITTNCGFLSIFQSELAAAVPIPVATSSLMQVPLVNATLPAGKTTGILTVSGSTLSHAHLAAARVPANTPIGTTEGGKVFSQAIIGNRDEMDVAQARRDNVEAAEALVARHPEIGALVLECTNMTPYAADIARAVDLPVHSMDSFITWFQRGLKPRRFPLADD